ncbi:MAG: GCN5-related N-acetyltransferase [Firmicutes bacterium]|nr:GCN5-related N-acetyltransferase [Bacillota bacterium]
MVWEKEDFFISTDKVMLDVALIHYFISTQTNWGEGRSREMMQTAMDNSAYCFGVYRKSIDGYQQIGFARVVSDLATFGYIADVFILDEFRGKGLGRWLIQTIVEHPALKKLKRLTLFTRIPEFYRQAEFKVTDPDGEAKFMERKP